MNGPFGGGRCMWSFWIALAKAFASSSDSVGLWSSSGVRVVEDDLVRRSRGRDRFLRGNRAPLSGRDDPVLSHPALLSSSQWPNRATPFVEAPAPNQESPHECLTLDPKRSRTPERYVSRARRLRRS